ncbi:MAG: MarR family winged helix-turn-helix transcriptional regulator [Pseudomonadota bacterium]
MDDVRCYCTKARRVARRLTAIYDEALEPAGLKTPQFGLLRAIERAGAPSITELAAATDLDRSTLGRNLRVLHKHGFVDLGSGTDERARIVRLRERGLEAIAHALPLWEAVQRHLEDRWPAGDRALFDRLADELAELTAPTTYRGNRTV